MSVCAGVISLRVVINIVVIVCVDGVVIGITVARRGGIIHL